jgi:5-methylcytosine-specific restriction endonuclease McrBC regulatory subunit McrC
MDWSRRQTIGTTSWVGTMRVPGGFLDILPKTGFSDMRPGLVQQRLLRLLATAGMLPIEDRDWGGVSSQAMPLWDGIAIAVARRLSRALLAGIPRAYRRIDDDAPVIRGRLRVEVLVRQTPPRLERPPIAYDELTTDTGSFLGHAPQPLVLTTTYNKNGTQ